MNPYRIPPEAIVEEHLAWREPMWKENRINGCGCVGDACHSRECERPQPAPLWRRILCAIFGHRPIREDYSVWSRIYCDCCQRVVTVVPIRISRRAP